MIQLPAPLSPVIDRLIAEGCRPVLVGGYLRDLLLGIPSKDIDIEVFGVESLSHLETLLLPFGKVNSVGKSFGVVKLQLEGLTVDFSLPRLEEKIAEGHRGFSVTLDPSLDFKEAAVRRDFTINAMGYDLKGKSLLDPFKGEEDLKNRRLDAVNPNTFVEDPLRLYRAMQLSARFGLEATPRLRALARLMVREKMLDELPKERIFEEFKKLLLKSSRPSVGFALMDDFGMLVHFTELKALQGIPQDPDDHPEGDVWTHTMMVLDAMTRLHGNDEKRNLRLSLAALCHDLGKATTTETIDGRISAVGHEIAGLKPTERFIRRISDEKELLEGILPLVRYHRKIKQFYKEKAGAPEIRRLAIEANISELILLAKADFLGRTTAESLRGQFRAGEWMQERAEELNVLHAPLEPLLKGRDLVASGMAPSKAFKEILQRAYDAQLDGKINSHEEALLWLQKHR